MPVYAGKVDLRSIKTEKALNTAMFSLLEKQSFMKINVSSICREALISRATFYSHFADKYDFLKYWLLLNLNHTDKADTYELIERKVNNYVNKYKTVIYNLVYGADNETLGILFDSVLSTLSSTISGNVKRNPKQIVLSNFYAGGMIYYLMWQIENKFPSDVALMNTSLFELIEIFREWEST